jgi:hypothetical protein
MAKIDLILLLLLLPATLTSIAQQKTADQASKTEDKALSMIDRLPEMKKVDNYYHHHLHGKWHMAAVVMQAPGKGYKYFAIQIGEDQSERFATWYSFLVDPKTGEILYEDKDTGKDISLRAWRKKKNYMGLD